MSETIKTGWMKDEAGNKLAPKTVIGQVLNEDGTVFNPIKKTSELDNDKGFVTTDTKNTTGATNTDTGKLYLVGSLSQDDETQTYTDKNIFIDKSHNNLYSKGYIVRDEESDSLIFQTNIYGEYAKAGSSGTAQLAIGSSRSLNQDGDYIGHIYQYSDNYHYTDLVPALGLTTNPVITLPNKSGTLATTDDSNKVLQKYDETYWESCLLLSGCARNYSESDYLNTIYRSKKISANPGVGSISVIVDDLYTDSNNNKYEPCIAINDGNAYNSHTDTKVISSVAKIAMGEKGTSNILGKSYVKIGNYIPTGTNGNSKGYVYVYNSKDKYTSIESSDELTENVQLILPSDSGELSLKNDIPNKISQLSNDTGYITSSGTAKTISDTLPISKGGTGKTTGVDAANTLINSLSTGESTPTDADYYISQYAAGGTTTTTYHRRPMRALWNYIKSKLATVAMSGSYNDLSNKPTIPTVGNGTVTIKQAGTSKGTFTMNQSGNTTIELTDNNTTYGVATQSANGLESAADKKKLDGIATGAEVNQNAFTNVVVGSTTISADSKTDSLTLAGSNVTLTPDATNDKVTIGITKSNVTTALGYTPPTTNTTYGVATSSALGLVKSGTDITVDSSGNVSVNDDSHNHVISNVDGLQSVLDGKASSSHTHDDRYYTESEIDSKLNGKANSSHGNHVPATQTANNAVFLRNDNTWQTVTPTNIGAAKNNWTLVGSGTSVDISSVYSNAYEWYVAVLDANNMITDFNIPYNKFSINGNTIHTTVYYYSNNYYATIAVSFTSKAISINTVWTKVQYGSGKTSNTATIYVYYR